MRKRPETHGAKPIGWQRLTQQNRTINTATCKRHAAAPRAFGNSLADRAKSLAAKHAPRVAA
eukprot:9424285-Lingulodinium_polyedra.AAC.1